ncbi:uncharacterized protein LOC111829304 [Capsella rubella]|uniref:uncharacterized protein LOC111829304 n=1 Tax=Capsella rubella TaxID=81985 RepID=UPI000CD525F9|nr:uncharacterized protein LOC111829304 [Capsella rubella]
MRFIKCQVGNGSVGWFWFDSWTSLGPLIKLFGETGPTSLRVPVHAKISDAFDSQGWKLRRPRSDKDLALQVYLSTIPLPTDSDDDDWFDWVIDGISYDGYNAGKTWEAIRHKSPVKDWASSIWFKGSTPRHAFNMWLANLDRLPTMSRLASWGLPVSPTCCLCSSSEETRLHLFIECSYTREVWAFIFTNLQLPETCLSSWDEMLEWTRNRLANSPRTLRLLLVQCVIYTVWRQRNNLIHNQLRLPPSIICKDIDRQIRNSITARRHMTKFKKLMPLWLR